MKKQTAVKYLFLAARTGDAELLSNMAAMVADVNIRDDYGYTPLTTAVVTGHAECAELLINAGADINVKDKWNNRLLCLGYNTPACIKVLLQAGADPCAGDPYGDTPLHYAAEAGQQECIKLLLDAGADPNAVNDSRSTPLHRAAGKSAESTLLLLEAGADVHARNSGGETPLHKASSEGMWGSFEHLVKAGADLSAADNCGNTALFCSASGGSAECVKYLLEHGADPNKANNYGDFAIFKAVQRSAECTKLLLDHGADVNARDRFKQTPIFKALSEIKGTECLKLLLKYGADTCALDVDGRNALHWAALEAPNKVNILIKAGAAPDIADCEGNTPFYLAASGGHVAAMRFLIKAGVDPFAEDSTGGRFSPLEILEQKYPYVYASKIDSILKLAKAPERGRLKKEDKRKAVITGFEFDI